MKVYNLEKSEIVTDVDLRLGYLKDDIIEYFYPEVEEIPERGHLEVVRIYPNGGKDIRWIVDVPGVPYQPARIDRENVKVFVPFNEEQLRKRHHQEVLELEHIKMIRLKPYYDELFEIQSWFINYYTQYEQKCRRLIALGKKCDDNRPPEENLNKLYLIAEMKRERIKEIEDILYG